MTYSNCIKTTPNPTLKLSKKLSRFLDGPYALPFAALIGFLENTLILFAMEPVYLPAMASKGRDAWQVATALLIGNLIAAFCMYALGMWAAEPLLEPLFASFDAAQSYHAITAEMETNGFWPLFIIGITPVPFQIGAAAAGAAGFSVLMFIIAVTTSRAIRYFAEAGFIMALGSRGQAFIEKHQLEIFLIGIGMFLGMGLIYFLN